MKTRNVKIIGFFIIATGILIALTALVMGPDFVAAQFSPDGELAGSTIQKLQKIRIFTGAIGVLLAGIGTLAVVYKGATEKVVERISKIKYLPLWVLPLLFAILLFPLKGVNTSPDSAWYVSNALNIYKGYGYVDASWNPVLNRGPVFPGLIAGFFWLFGVSVKHAFWVVRVFFVLNSLLVFLIGRKLWNRWVGLSASFLVLTSLTINIWSSKLLLDIVLPFFLLLFIWLLYLTAEEDNWYWSALAGLSLALAYLTKEMAIIAVPLPIAFYVLAGGVKFKNRIIDLGLIYGFFAAAVVPWGFHVYSQTEGFSLLIGWGGPKLLQRLYSPGTANSLSVGHSIVKYVGWVVRYFNQYLRELFFLSPLMLISWVVLIIYYFVKNKKESLLLMLSAGVFLPIMLFLGKEGWRAGQSVYFYFLTYLALSVITVKTVSWISDWLSSYHRFSHRSNYKSLLIGLVILGLIFGQVFGERRMLSRWFGTGNTGPSFYMSSAFQVGGWHNSRVEEVGEWLTENLSDGEVFMSDWYWGRSIYFFAGGDNKLVHIPYIVSTDPSCELEDPNPLFIWPHLNNASVDNKVRVLDETTLNNKIKASNIRIIISTFRRNFLSRYFRNSKGYRAIGDWGRIDIFGKIRNQKDSDFKTQIGSQLPNYLHSLKKEWPTFYNKLTSDFFESCLSLSKEQISKMEEGEYDTFDLWSDY